MPARLNALIGRGLYPIDATTGLRVFNPDGVRIVNINDLLETHHDETDSNCGAHRSRPAAGSGSRHETEQNHVERARRHGAARVPRPLDGAHVAKGRGERAPMTNRALARRLNTLAKELRLVARATTSRRAASRRRDRSVSIHASNAGVSST